MRSLIDIVSGRPALKESVVTYIVQRYDPDQREYPIYKNGSKRDLRNILREMRSDPDRHIRALIDSEGNLYFWDAYAASHIEIVRRFALGDALHLVLKNDAVQLGWGRQGTPDLPIIASEMKVVRDNPYVRAIYGTRMRIDIARTVDESVIKSLF